LTKFHAVGQGEVPPNEGRKRSKRKPDSYTRRKRNSAAFARRRHATILVMRSRLEILVCVH